MDWFDVQFFFEQCVEGAIDVVKENPIKTVAVAGMAVAGAAAFVFAPPLAAVIVSQIPTATASTGTLISTLSGAAATNASLAYLGGGALAAGGGGMATGTVAVTTIGTFAGGAVSGVAANIAS